MDDNLAYTHKGLFVCIEYTGIHGQISSIERLLKSKGHKRYKVAMDETLTFSGFELLGWVAGCPFPIFISFNFHYRAVNWSFLLRGGFWNWNKQALVENRETIISFHLDYYKLHIWW